MNVLGYCFLFSLKKGKKGYEKKVYTVMFNNSFNINKTSNHPLSQLTEHKKKSQHVRLEFHVLAWDRNKNVAEFNQLIGSHFTILLRPFSFFCSQRLTIILLFTPFHNECIWWMSFQKCMWWMSFQKCMWWMLFQKCIVCTKSDKCVYLKKVYYLNVLFFSLL
jgi:hypothetical protein